ncbi:FecR family protein [Paraflavisolibacter caeni]|nr:FecR family protein [Paraflavisolibacter caeni]
MLNIKIEEIIINFIDGTITSEEACFLNKWIQESEINKQLFEELTHPELVSKELQKFYTYDEELGWNRIETELAHRKKIKQTNWKYWTAAACMLGVIVTTVVIFFKGNDNIIENKVATVVKNDVEAPQSKRAFIQLANGETVALSSVEKGILTEQGRVNIVKNSEGQIVYQGHATETVFNTLVNPRGGTVVSLVLNDGTRVWLNSESSLKYPNSFSGNERIVEITGEAYFEVAKDPAKKFIVKGNGVITEVFGTHFNVNTYNDEAETKVTLQEGSVRVLKGASSGFLKPGQRAAFSNKSDQMAIDNTDVDKVLAWVYGDFNFDDETLPDIMRQLARWYDLEVSFEGKPPADLYSGIISRKSSLVTVLQILNAAEGIKYSIEGKKIKIERTK